MESASDSSGEENEQGQPVFFQRAGILLRDFTGFMEYLTWGFLLLGYVWLFLIGRTDLLLDPVFEWLFPAAFFFTAMHLALKIPAGRCAGFIARFLKRR